MAEFDINKLQTSDRLVAGTGLAVFVLSFLPWYGVSGGDGPFKVSAHVSGWGMNFWPKLAIVLSLAAAAFVAARAMGFLAEVELPAGPAFVTVALSGFATIILILRLLTFKTGNALGVDVGPRFGIYLAILASIAQTVFAFLAFRTSGETLPGTTSTPPPTPPPAAP